MARELVDEIQAHNARGEADAGHHPLRPGVLVPPFTALVNAERVSLRRPGGLPHGRVPGLAGAASCRAAHPYSFRGFMEEHFYGRSAPELAVPEENRYWLTPGTRRRGSREAIAPGADRHHLRRLGPGRPHRLQPGPPPSVQPRDRGRRARLDHPHPGEQPRHDHGAGPAHLRRAPTSSCRRCR